ILLLFQLLRRPPTFTLSPYTTLFRSNFRRAGVLKKSPRTVTVVPRCRTAGATRSSRPPVTLSSTASPPSEVIRVKRETEAMAGRSEEHTYELQSRVDLVCRLLLEKKKPDGGSRDERAAQGMIRWGELKRPAAQVGGGPWVGRSQRLSGTEERRAGGLAPWLSARH